MKKLTFISGPLFMAFMIFGALFKILHWGFGGLFLTIGLGGMAVVFIPSLAKTLYDNSKNS